MWLSAKVRSSPSSVRPRRSNCAPALLTSTSIRGYAARSSAPSRRISLISTRFAPNGANASAAARPIPEVAPVITQTFSRTETAQSPVKKRTLSATALCPFGEERVGAPHHPIRQEADPFLGRQCGELKIVHERQRRDQR